VLEVILVLHFVFRLLDTSQGKSFLLFLYHLSHAVVAPFHGIFHNQTPGKGNVFELSALIAMLIAPGHLVFAPIESGRQRVTTIRRSSGDVPFHSQARLSAHIGTSSHLGMEEICLVWSNTIIGGEGEQYQGIASRKGYDYDIGNTCSRRHA
jgi:hypothetical protein